jgi:hypothetical protein
MAATYSSNVRYHPWVGKQYEQQKTRWLILGESAYDLLENEQRANEYMIRAHNGDGQDGWCVTQYAICTAVEKLMTGLPQLDGDEKRKFWDSVVFYNFVRDSMADAKVRPTSKQFIESRPAFSEVISRHRPDAVLVLGLELWRYLPGTKEGWVEGQEHADVPMPHPYKRRLLSVWTGYSDGKAKKDPFACFQVAHPASRGFNAGDWARWMTAGKDEIERLSACWGQRSSRPSGHCVKGPRRHVSATND